MMMNFKIFLTIFQFLLELHLNSDAFLLSAFPLPGRDGVKRAGLVRQGDGLKSFVGGVNPLGGTVGFPRNYFSYVA